MLQRRKSETTMETRGEGAGRRDGDGGGEANSCEAQPLSQIADLSFNPRQGRSRFRLRSIQFERGELQILSDCPRAYYRTLPG